jgi:hypothetical protein
MIKSLYEAYQENPKEFILACIAASLIISMSYIALSI